MAGSFGDAEAVRRLGQALLAAGKGAAAVTSDLSGEVKSLVPAGWSGAPAERFGSDWNGKAGRAGQLAAACTHVGQVLLDLAGELDSANQRAASARQVAGGPTAIRFGEPGQDKQSAQLLSQAAGAADQARAAARAKLAGVRVPRIGAPLTASEVDAWASPMAPGLVPPLERLTGAVLGDIRDFAQRTGLATGWGTAEHVRVTGFETVGQEAHFTEGIANGLTGMFRSLGDLAPGPDGGLGRWLWGDQSAEQSWEGIYHLAAPFLGQGDPTAPSALEAFGRGFVAWHEWRTDPSRAAGNVFFNFASLFLGPKFLRLKGSRGTATGGTEAPRGVGSAMPTEEDPTSPGPPPSSFARPATEPPPLDSIEEAPSGSRSNFMAEDEAFVDNVALAGRIEGYHDVIVHGSGSDFGPTADAWDRGANFSHRVLANLIRHDPDYSGGPIRLIACSKAEGATAAQNLANKLGVEVLAANDTVWAFPGGHLVVGPTPFAPMGGWEHFYPGKGG